MKDAILKLIGDASAIADAQPKGGESVNHYLNGWKDACNSIYKKVEKIDPWVSVEEGLPEAGKEVLILTNGQEKEQVVGFITEDGRWLMELGYNYDEPAGPNNYPVPQAETFKVVNVTGWMPLPQPPKAKL